MTSLFRRSSSNGGSRSGSGGGSGGGSSGGSSGPGGELNNSRPPRQVRRLEFNQAMEDFKVMFPTMDYEVIECVLRSNSGAVDATIDQLLQMSIDGQGSDDSSDSDDSIPPEILERTLEPDSSDEEPPPVYSPPTYDMHIYDRKYPGTPYTPPPRFEERPPPGHRQIRRSYRNWNPPLLGNLPDDFLRILPQQMDSIQRSQSSTLSQPASSSTSSTLSSVPPQQTAPSSGGGCGSAGGSGGGGGGGGEGGGDVAGGVTTEQERRTKQYLEDERIALFLQNEEFMRELQRNREFLIALERDRLKYESKKSRASHSSGGMENSTAGEASGSMEACTAVSDDAMFRDKLKHMGKSTRKKLFEIARTFSEKTKRRKSKRRTLLKHHSLGTANSTANLLDDVEGSPYEEDGQLKRLVTQEEEEPQKDTTSWCVPGILYCRMVSLVVREDCWCGVVPPLLGSRSPPPRAPPPPPPPPPIPVGKAIVPEWLANRSRSYSENIYDGSWHLKVASERCRTAEAQQVPRWFGNAAQVKYQDCWSLVGSEGGT